MSATPSDRVVVITGAARGMGREWVRQLAAEPNTFVVAIVRKTPSTPELEALKGSKVAIIEGDMAKEDEYDAVAEKISAVTGGKVDVLINNAAIMIGAGAKKDVQITASTWKEWEETFKIDLFAPIFFTKALIPLLNKSSEKKVVFISSFLAQHSFHNMVNGGMAFVSYSASKAAMNLANLKFHHEFRDEGYKFVTINPGWVQTELDNPGHIMLDAPLTVEQSVSRQRSFVDRISKEDSGKDFSLDGLEDLNLIQ